MNGGSILSTVIQLITSYWFLWPACCSLFSREFELLIWVNNNEILKLIKLNDAILARVEHLHHGDEFVIVDGDAELGQQAGQLVD